MGDSKKGASPVEYYLWRRRSPAEAKTTEKTIQETAADGNLIGDALKIFNSRIRTVRRSSGGLSVAEPYQIVFFDENGGKDEKPEVRIKVRFKDFKINKHGELTTGVVTTHTKVVSPAELGEAFSYNLETSKLPSFVADFGRGIVPVHVVHFATEPDGGHMVYFIEQGDLGRWLEGGERRTGPVQVYRMDRDLLRYASTTRHGGRKTEYDVALENYLSQKRSGQVVIPPQLAWGSPVRAEAGRSPKDLRLFLSRHIALGVHCPQAVASITRTVNTGEMLPFGIFES